MRALLLRGLVVAVVVALVAAGGWYFYGCRAKSRFEARVEALRAARQPTRFEEIAPPPIPDEENGAKLLEEAGLMLRDWRRSDLSVEILFWEEEHTDEECEAIVAYLESLAPCFALLEQIPKRPGFRPEIRRSQEPLKFLNPCIPALRDATTLLAARVAFDPDGNDHTERAAATTVLLLELGERGVGPFEMGLAEAWLATTRAVALLRKVMRAPGFDAATFRKIVDPKLAEVTPDRGPPASVFVEERAHLLDLVRAIDAGDVQTGGRVENRWLSFLYRPGLFNDAIACLDLVEEAIRCADTTPEDALQVGTHLPSKYSKAAGRDDLVHGSGVLYALVFSNYSRHVARLRLARVVMALLEHRQTKGAWPESLKDLGEMPTDPFSGEPFLYERTEHGCKVRSAREASDKDLEDEYLLWTLEDDQIPAMAR